MSKGLPQVVRDNVDKCRSCAIAAVDVYNRPGPRFRTAHYIVLIVMAWTALFHAISYRKGKRPWYRKAKPTGAGAGVRYVKVDGDYKHWELSECLKQHYGDKNPAERKNLEFLVGLRNKIEHRNIPQLDPSLYGECQSSLLNLEAMLSAEFGAKYALMDQLAVSLQLSQLRPEEKQKATKVLASSAAKSVVEYIEKFRLGLESPILNSMQYCYSVFLVPRVANREKAADAAVQFVRVDEASPAELQRLQNLNVLIRDKSIPIVNYGFMKPSAVVEFVQQRIQPRFNPSTHVRAWRHFAVRPPHGDLHPERTKSEYCVYVDTHKDYVYTKAWAEMLARELSDPEKYLLIVGNTGGVPVAA